MLFSFLGLPTYRTDHRIAAGIPILLLDTPICSTTLIFATIHDLNACCLLSEVYRHSKNKTVIIPSLRQNKVGRLDAHNGGSVATINKPDD